MNRDWPERVNDFRRSRRPEAGAEATVVRQPPDRQAGEKYCRDTIKTALPASFWSWSLAKGRDKQSIERGESLTIVADGVLFEFKLSSNLLTFGFMEEERSERVYCPGTSTQMAAIARASAVRVKVKAWRAREANLKSENLRFLADFWRKESKGGR